MTVLGGVMHRCHHCNVRYIVVGGSLLGAAHLRRVSERLFLALIMITAAVAVAAAIFWFSHAPAGPADDADCRRPAGFSTTS